MGSIAKWQDRKKGFTNSKDGNKKHERQNYMKLQFEADQKGLAKFRRLIAREKNLKGESTSSEPIDTIKETPK